MAPGSDDPARDADPGEPVATADRTDDDADTTVDPAADIAPNDPPTRFAIDEDDLTGGDPGSESGAGGAARRRVSAFVARARADLTPWLLGIAIAVWIVVFGRLIWQRHARFSTFDFDLGHHDQAIWLLSQGKGFITVSGMPVLGHHVTLAYFGVVPLYWLGGGPQLLDLLQTVALAVSAVPIYLLARHRLGNPWLALALGVAWLLNPSVQWLCWEAWHPEAMAIPFLLSAYLFASREQWRWYWVALVIALSWKEDISIAVAVLGVVLALSGRRRVGLLTLGVGVVWFVVAYGVIMPHFNGGTNQAGIFYGDLGSSPTELARTARQ